MSRTIAVVGLGNMGREVARFLSMNGAQVLAIDRNEDRAQQVSGQVSRAVAADGTDRDALKRLGVDRMDGAVVALRENIEASVMTTLVLARHLGVPEVFARAVNDHHAEILSAVGATTVVAVEREMGRRIGASILWPGIRDYYEISGSQVLAEVAAREEMVGKTFQQLDFKNLYGVYCTAIRRPSECEEPEEVLDLPAADIQIEENDILVLLGPKARIEKI